MPLKSLLLIIGAGWIMLGSLALGPGLIVYPLAWTAVAVGFYLLHRMLGGQISGISTQAVASKGAAPHAGASGSSSRASTA
ncbi:hypothetical protein LOC68_27285 [Blastopirellula sp. JC732]|uniref:Uncharacterized protein n=1 Tax=Blastopirellula sediminis TaxID=2894196 RepID=A0A9X1MTB8_9BACT|nr:hypothetical protein [Blastopirellula sediminis]MCC9604586.1 hypothetical protein [Blastopirellula sediminis]MCC9632115.1 hypothetical protein [Blastopirellula sediminis]